MTNPIHSAQPRNTECPNCRSRGTQFMRMGMVPCGSRDYRLRGLLVQLRGYTVRAWCCHACGNIETDPGSWLGNPRPEPRPEIVNAIRRLKAAGHRFFDWEK